MIETFKILVDADACPVKEFVVKIAKELKIEVLMVIDTSHILNDGYSKIITVDKGADSADFAILNRAKKGDIVVTQDYGLASLVLSKGCFAINQNGLIYTEKNIDKLLFERHLNKEIRMSGGRNSAHPKRKKVNDEMFVQSFHHLLKTLLCIG